MMQRRFSKNARLGRFSKNARLGRFSKGFTLLEVSIVLLIGGLVLGAIAVGVNKAIGSTRSNNEVSMIQSVASTVQKHFANKSSFATISTSEEAKRGTFPTDLVDTTTYAVNSRWGGAMTLASVAAGARFSLSITNMPEYECKQVVPDLDQVSYTVTVGGAAVKAANAATDISALNTACAGGGVTVVYEFTK